MRRHKDPDKHEELVSYIKDYEGYDVLVDLEMYLKDRPVDDKIDGGSYGIDSGGPAWFFSGNMEGRIPSYKYRNAPFKIVVDVGGVRMAGLNARGSMPVGRPDWSTDLLAATPGSLLSSTTLDEYVTYNNVSPEAAIRDALYRTPGYRKGQISVAEFGRPLISRGMGGEFSGFEDEDNPQSILDSVAEEVDVTYHDNVLGGHDARAKRGLGQGREVAWHYEAGSGEVLEEFEEPTSVLPEEQIWRVVARDRLPDPDATNGTGPGGRYRIWQEREVDYSLLEHPPARATTQYIAVTDTSGEAAENARLLCIDAARSLSLGRGKYNGNIVVAFNHLLEPTDVVTVGEQHEDETGFYRRVWRCSIEAINHIFDPASMQTELAFSAVLALQERMADPPIVLRGLSIGVVPIASRPTLLAFVHWGQEDIYFGSETLNVGYGELN